MMNAWQIDTMWEEQAAAAWERTHGPDPCEAQLMEAGKSLEVVIQHLDKAAEWILSAEAELEETPMADQAESFADQVYDIRIQLQEMAQKWQRGVRE